MKQSELTVGQTYFDKYNDGHKCVLLKTVKRGDFVKLNLNSSVVYSKSEYNKREKDYDLSNENDISLTSFKKGSTKVFINFTY
tara:strand:+ start:169 stop:417 length:249 start_codon:yes stop_codon:yes gene_type:complete